MLLNRIYSLRENGHELEQVDVTGDPLANFPKVSCTLEVSNKQPEVFR